MTERLTAVAEGARRVLPALYALLAPMVFLPNSVVDAYILPRVALTAVFGALLGGAALAVAGRPRGRLATAGAAVAGAAVLACATSINPWLSIAGAYTRYESVLVRLAYLGLFAGSAVLLAGRERRPARVVVLAAFVAGSTVSSLIALGQFFGHTLDRPDGNLGQPNLLGALLAMAIVVSLQVGFRFWPFLLTLPVLCLGLGVSLSRSGWIGAFVGCVVALVCVLPPRWRRRGLLGAAALMAAAALVLFATPLRSLNNDTGSARVGVWGDGVRMVAARPLAGWGEDATGLVLGRFQTADWEPGHSFDRIHEQPLDLLATQGLVGFGACAWFWLLVVWSCGRAARAATGGAGGLWMGPLLGALAAYGAWSLLNFDWAPVTGPFWFLGGLAWAEAAEDRPLDRSGERAPSFGDGMSVAGAGRPMAWAVAGALTAVAAVTAATTLLADAAYYRGQAGRAVALAPLQAQYHRVAGEALGPGPAGLRELERARDLGEYDYSFFVELGDWEKQSGRPEAARAAYERAVELYRWDPAAAQRLAALGR